MRAFANFLSGIPHVGKPALGFLMFGLLITVVVGVHEFGHLVAFVLLGVAVDAFSIGFGPEVFGFDAGGIHWQLSAIPLGGYVMPNMAAYEAASAGTLLIALFAGIGFNALYLVGMILLLKRLYANSADYAFKLEMRGFLFWPFVINSMEAGKHGTRQFFWYTAVVSFDLFLLNLLPIFPLDGGKIFAILVGLVLPNMGQIFILLVGIWLAIVLLGKCVGSPAGRQRIVRLYNWMGAPEGSLPLGQSDEAADNASEPEDEQLKLRRLEASAADVRRQLDEETLSEDERQLLRYLLHSAECQIYWIRHAETPEAMRPPKPNLRQ